MQTQLCDGIGTRLRSCLMWIGVYEDYQPVRYRMITWYFNLTYPNRHTPDSAEAISTTVDEHYSSVTKRTSWHPLLSRTTWHCPNFCISCWWYIGIRYHGYIGWVSFKVHIYFLCHHFKHRKNTCRDFLDVNMTRTRMYISFLKPLLGLLDPPLEEFITRCKIFHFVMAC